MPFPDATAPLTPPQPISDWAAPVSGLPALGEGGYLIFGTLESPVVTRLVDVVHWSIAEGFGESPIAKGGMLGATSSRRTGYAIAWECEIVTDLRIQPNLLFQVPSVASPWKATDVQAWFRLGSPPGSVRPRYYWVPRLKLASLSPAVDAGDKRRVRQRLSGTANSHVFLLPEEGDPLDPATLAGAYNAWLTLHPYG